MRLTKRLRNAIRRLMAKKRWNNTDLARELGVSKVSVGRWLNEDSPQGHIKDRCVEELRSHGLEWEPSRTVAAIPVDEVDKIITRAIDSYERMKTAGRARPVPASGREMGRYGTANCATESIRVGDVIPGSDHEVETEEVPHDCDYIDSPASFEALDDSMSPLINEGDLIIFDAVDNNPRNGEIVIVKVDGDILCKGWFREDTTATLKSINPDIPDREIHLEDVEWIYRVSAVQPPTRHIKQVKW